MRTTIDEKHALKIQDLIDIVIKDDLKNARPKILIITHEQKFANKLWEFLNSPTLMDFLNLKISPLKLSKYRKRRRRIVIQNLMRDEELQFLDFDNPDYLCVYILSEDQLRLSYKQSLVTTRDDVKLMVLVPLLSTSAKIALAVFGIFEEKKVYERIIHSFMVALRSRIAMTTRSRTDYLLTNRMF